MKLRLMAIGKMKNPAFAEVAKDYAGRIQHYYPIEVEEIPEESIRPKEPKGPALEREAAKILKRLNENSYLVILDEKGVEYRSVDLAFEFKKLLEGPSRELVFIIGGSYGLAEVLKKNADLLWSLSKLTLPHRLARVLTLEQIYRALTILRNVPYHH